MSFLGFLFFALCISDIELEEAGNLKMPMHVDQKKKPIKACSFWPKEQPNETETFEIINALLQLNTSESSDPTPAHTGQAEQGLDSHPCEAFTRSPNLFARKDGTESQDSGNEASSTQCQRRLVGELGLPFPSEMSE